MKILVWGCGGQSEFLVEKKYIDKEKILCFIDNNQEIKEFLGFKVYRPREILSIKEEYDYIIVTVKNYYVNIEILNQIKRLGIHLDKVIFIYNYFRESKNYIIKQQDNNIIKEISELLFYNVAEVNKMQVERANDTITCSYDLVDPNKIIGTGSLNDDSSYMKDYTRYRTFELVANEIEKMKLKGSVAEVGVFRGMFAEIINAKFHNRKLYLFDSFEGFKPDEYEQERNLNNCDEGFQEVFVNTDVDILLKRLPHPNNCIVRKGFFPESIEEEEKGETFVFVSIDVDFEESTHDCLNFFYPRLVECGYIFLHDYNNRNLRGVKSAIDRFENDNSISLKKVPISDEGGTLIIIK